MAFLNPNYPENTQGGFGLRRSTPIRSGAKNQSLIGFFGRADLQRTPAIGQVVPRRGESKYVEINGLFESGTFPFPMISLCYLEESPTAFSTG